MLYRLSRPGGSHLPPAVLGYARHGESSPKKESQKMTSHQSREERDEASRFYQAERRLWRGRTGHEPGAGFPRAGADKNGFQGIRRSAGRLSDRGGDRESGQET